MATTLPTSSVNANALRRFTTTDPSRAEIFSDPAKLKSAFADAVKRAVNRSPDADWGVNGGNEAKLYHEALTKIYGISDYSPPGWRSPD